MKDNLKLFENYCDWLYETRLRQPFPQVSKEELQKDGIIVYGLSGWGKAAIAELAQQGIKPAWAVDRSTEFHENGYLGIDVRPLSSLLDAGNRFVMLTSTHIRDMADTCMIYGAEKWILPAAIRDWCAITGEFGICNDNANRIPELKEAFQLLADEKSREVFRAFIRWHYTYDNNFAYLSDPVFYFPDDLREMIDYRFFVDAGAYNGDTLQDWLRICAIPQGAKYYAFEPNPESYQELGATVAGLPDAVKSTITVINSALGSVEGSLRMNSAGGMNRYSETGIDIPCQRIDDLFAELCPTIIKADIEGAEMDMLQMAEKTIRRCRPTLAISAYHKFSDLWAIPLWIHNLGCGYKIYMRHHPKVFTDSVYYAICT
ncbi:MAG: FkbM family methyltransferase [Lachnospiraceae bacterium]|jgi:FkbM family methyltransferase|nr:FkbM family methyltransferase [Lachnospiraceae bacterium]